MIHNNRDVVQLVEHLLWEQGVVRSSRIIPTTKTFIMVIQFLSDTSLKAYIRHFTQLLEISDNENIKRFLEQCKKELDKRNG